MLIWCTLILIVVLIPSAQSSSLPHGGSFKYEYNRNYNTNNSRRRQSQRSEVAAPPCKLFVWDAPSAFRYHLCKRLLRGNIYEGLGGKRFVRIKPKSVLESLYPPSSHGSDRCLLCHHTFADHLASWWFPNRYTPFDTWLDDTRMNYSEEVETVPGVDTKKKKKSQRRKNRIAGSGHVDLEQRLSEAPHLNPISTTSRPMPKRVYHKQYVTDITQQMKQKHDKKNNNKRRDRDRPSSKKDLRLPTNDKHIVLEGKYEKRHVYGVLYQVPRFQFQLNNDDDDDDDDDDDKKEDTGRIRFGKAATLLLTRVLILERFNGSLYLQEKENKWKWSRRLFL